MKYVSGCLLQSGMETANSASNDPPFPRLHADRAVVVIAIIAILAGLLLPALGRAKQKAQGVACMNNMRQLQLGWHQYAHDNRDEVVPNSHGNEFVDPDSWAPGLWTYTSPNATNSQRLVENRPGSLGPYVGSARVFKCPTDMSVVTLPSGKFPRARSYGMNHAVGNLLTPLPANQLWPEVRRLSEINSLNRPQIFIFGDVHPDFVWGADIWLDWREDDVYGWIGLPAARHGQADPVSFHDGHVEIHKWQDATTFQPVTGSSREYIDQLPAASKTRDWAWLYQRTTRRYRNDPFP